MKFFDKLAKLERLAKRSPSMETLNMALDLIDNPILNRQFYAALESAGWLILLMEKGMFSNPPGKETLPGKGIKYADWPILDYLLRMINQKKLSPLAINMIVFSIPVTDNIRVRLQIIELMQYLPVSTSTKLLPLLYKWIDEGFGFYENEKVAQLAIVFLKQKQIRIGFNLLKKLFEISEDPSGGKIINKKKQWRLSPEPKLHMSEHEYESLLEKYMPKLLEFDQFEALSLFTELLENYTVYSHQKIKRPYDLSTIWRPAVENHSQNSPNSLSSKLVMGVRDTAEYILQKNPTKKNWLKIQRLFTKANLVIFERIFLHLLRKYPENASGLIQKILVNKKYFDSTYYKHEYFLLISEQFNNLTSKQRSIIIGWIEHGRSAKDLEKYKLNFKRWYKRDYTTRDIENFQNYWKLERLEPIIKHVDDNWKKKYDEWIGILGKPEHPDFSSYTTSWVGPESPITSDELSLKDDEDLIKYLKGTKLTYDDFGKPSMIGLGSELSNLIKNNFERFEKIADKFVELNEAYIEAVIRGYTEAIRQGQTLSKWDKHFLLLNHIVKQRTDELTKKNKEKISWRNSAKGAVDYIEEIIEKDLLPVAYSNLTVKLLIDLCRDDEPESTTEEKRNGYGGFYTIAINSIRSSAIEALIKFSLWKVRVYSNANMSDKKFDITRDEDVKEVLRVLDIHLDLSKEKSLAVHAVYGRWFPWLALINEGWAASRMEKVFPMDEKLHSYFNAAWNAYISFIEPYNQMIKLMTKVYLHAINTQYKKSDDSEANHAQMRLDQHLMAYYWRGLLNLEEGGLLDIYFKIAPPTNRGNAIEFIGQGLEDSKETPDIIIERLKKLWEYRLSLKIEDELKEFGWWYSSGKLDEDLWSLKQLKTVIETVGWVEPEYKVLEKFNQDIHKSPELVITCLYKMVQSKPDNLGFMLRKEVISEIILNAINSDSTEAKSVGIDLIHTLGSMGYLEYRYLLPEKETEAITVKVAEAER